MRVKENYGRDADVYKRQVNGNLASIVKNQFYAGYVDVELTENKFTHSHISKMFFR